MHDRGNQIDTVYQKNNDILRMGLESGPSTTEGGNWSRDNNAAADKEVKVEEDIASDYSSRDSSETTLNDGFSNEDDDEDEEDEVDDDDDDDDGCSQSDDQSTADTIIDTNVRLDVQEDGTTIVRKSNLPGVVGRSHPSSVQIASSVAAGTPTISYTDMYNKTVGMTTTTTTPATEPLKPKKSNAGSFPSLGARLRRLRAMARKVTAGGVWKGSLDDVLKPTMTGKNKQGNCPYCQKHYGNLAQHTDMYCSKNPARRRLYHCCYCKFKAFEKDDVEKHKETHVLMRNFRCEICDNGFFNRMRLIRHMRYVHLTGNNPVQIYTCEHCNKEFRYRSHYDRHLTIHQGTHSYYVSYVCGICDLLLANTRITCARIRACVQTCHIEDRNSSYTL